MKSPLPARSACSARSTRSAFRASRRQALSSLTLAALGSALTVAWADPLVVTPQQRDTAQKVAQAGVPLSELAPNAPDSHLVKRGDTLWDISKLFLKSPWRWPELWGMNLEQIRNPHLIYPGQMLVLERSGDRARLRVAQEVGGSGNTVKLSPRVRSEALEAAIAAIPMHLIQPFLNEAVVLGTDELAAAPRIVATQEGRVIVSKGDRAYVRGPVEALREARIFREAKPLLDPSSRALLGYESMYLGTAEFVRAGGETKDAAGKPEIVPATFMITGTRREVGIGDRLASAPARDSLNFAPRAPAAAVNGQIVSVYGDGLQAGQNQIVALNKGSRDGLERGHVLALWRDGRPSTDRTDIARAALKLPDERHGMLFVFRTFEQVSYALILSVQEPVRAGDRFSQP
jgi:hypothetical protein